MATSPSPDLTVAVVGATGAVGREMMALLAKSELSIGRLRPMASARSAGTKLPWGDQELEVEDLAGASFEGVDLALFSAGGDTSLRWAPVAARAGATVIDNSSAWRMDPEVPLVVPEVNAQAAHDTPKGIIANPNCSTIQMVVALEPLRALGGLERVVVSTYQSVSGAGQQGIEELEAGTRGCLSGREPEPKTFAHPIAFEALPQIDVFFDSGYTKEELKMAQETRKIMALPGLHVSATCVRVPVMRAHSEAVTVDFDRPISLEQARRLLAQAPGVKLWDEPANNRYPLARRAAHTPHVWVGRLRQDLDRPGTLHMWVVADNLLKGAALNAVQIAQELV